MSPTRWRKSTSVFVGLAVLVFVAAVVAAATFFTMGGHGSSGARVPVPPPRPPVVKPGMVPVSDTAETPSVPGLAAALAPVAADPNLGRLGGRVTDAMTGKEIWQVADDLPLVPASTNKILTAAAALLTLDHQARISTRVVAGGPNAQGPIVLVGTRVSHRVVCSGPARVRGTDPRLLRRAGRRCRNYSGDGGHETESDDAASLHLDPSPVRRPCRSLRVSAPHVWYRPLLIPADAVTIR